MNDSSQKAINTTIKPYIVKRMDGVFREGEQLEIRGSLFRVHSITPKRMILKLLPRSQRVYDQEEIHASVG